MTLLAAVRTTHHCVEATAEGFVIDGVTTDAAGLVAFAQGDGSGRRWVWDTAAVYPVLLAAGVRVERGHDVRLARAILRRSALTASAYDGVAGDHWDEVAAPATAADDGLFSLTPEAANAGGPSVVAEFARQQAAIAAAPDPDRIRLLVAAESAGALAATEMRFAGLPWSAERHEAILTGVLGPRVPHGERPEVLAALLADIRAALGEPDLNPDSAPHLVKALRRAGLDVATTRSRELAALEHPVIPPLLEYKKLARLLQANGWHWLDTWVHDGRFHPEYVVGGVVTGRWATTGGGAMQLPKQIRAAVIADPGWRFVVADAAQLEPRVLAGMARDRSMAAAGAGRDLYDGIVATGAVSDRSQAKYGMLGALYGATTGPGGRLVPRLAQRYPVALGLVDAAAREGEAGRQVTTLLGRTSPQPSQAWRELQANASALEADDAMLRRIRSSARDQGRFTRNFVVQGTAAEWALCWLAELRKQLWTLGSGTLTERPHLVYFLHDEVVVHTPADRADEVAHAVRQCAAAAGRLLFGGFPVDFPLDVSLVENYADAE